MTTTNAPTPNRPARRQVLVVLIAFRNTKNATSSPTIKRPRPPSKRSADWGPITHLTLEPCEGFGTGLRAQALSLFQNGTISKVFRNLRKVFYSSEIVIASMKSPTAMDLTTSIPSITRPNAVYAPSRKGVGASAM
jgi:hypothetical protein